MQRQKCSQSAYSRFQLSSETSNYCLVKHETYKVCIIYIHLKERCMCALNHLVLIKHHIVVLSWTTCLNNDELHYKANCLQDVFYCFMMLFV